MRPAAPSWKNRPKLGWEAPTEMEVALRELRIDRELQELARKERVLAPKQLSNG